MNKRLSSAIKITKMLIEGNRVPMYEWLMSHHMDNVIDASYVFYFLGRMASPKDLDGIFCTGLNGSTRELLAFYEGCMHKHRFNNINWASRWSIKLPIWGVYDSIKSTNVVLFRFFIDLIEDTRKDPERNTIACPYVDPEPHGWSERRLSAVIGEITRAGWIDGVIVFIERGIDINKIIKSAIRWSNDDFIESLVEYFTKQEIKVDMNEVLKMVVQFGRVRLLDICLDGCVDDFSIAFNMAINRHYLMVIEAMLRHVNKEDKHGITTKLLNRALRVMLFNGRLEVAKDILWKGAELSALERTVVKMAMCGDETLTLIKNDYVLGTATRRVLRLNSLLESTSSRTNSPECARD